MKNLPWGACGHLSKQFSMWEGFLTMCSLTTNLIYLIDIGLFRLSIAFWMSFDSLCLSRNVSIKLFIIFLYYLFSVCRIDPFPQYSRSSVSWHVPSPSSPSTILCPNETLHISCCFLVSHASAPLHVLCLDFALCCSWIPAYLARTSSMFSSFYSQLVPWVTPMVFYALSSQRDYYPFDAFCLSSRAWVLEGKGCGFISLK